MSPGSQIPFVLKDVGTAGGVDILSIQENSVAESCTVRNDNIYYLYCAIEIEYTTINESLMLEYCQCSANTK